MRADVGEIGDQRLIVMAALSICDDYLEAHKANEDLRLRAAEALDVARSARDHAEATARMATEAMNESARRIEACAEALAEDDKDD